MQLLNNKGDAAVLPTIAILFGTAVLMGQPITELDDKDVEPNPTPPVKSGNVYHIPSDVKNMQAILNRLQPGDKVYIVESNTKPVTEVQDKTTITKAAPKAEEGSPTSAISDDLKTLRDALEKSLNDMKSDKKTAIPPTEKK